MAALDLRALGRSHRSALGKELLGRACSETARILGLPAGYRAGIVPASDIGAVEMVLWSLLGARGVDLLAWESFGAGWVNDVVNQLKLTDVTRHEAPYGWIHFLAQTPETRSNTSVCLTLELPPEKVKQIAALLETEGVAYDINAYKDAPPGLRIWCGATVERADLRALMDWLDWGYAQVK